MPHPLDFDPPSEGFIGPLSKQDVWDSVVYSWITGWANFIDEKVEEYRKRETGNSNSYQDEH